MPYLSYPEFKHRIYQSHVPRPAAIWEDRGTCTLYAEYIEPLTADAFQHVLHLLKVEPSQIQQFTSTRTTLVIRNTLL